MTQKEYSRSSPKILSIICSILLVILFTYAAYYKLNTYSLFRQQLDQSPFLSRVAGLMTWLTPAVEIVIVALLCIPRTRLTGLYCSFVLMVVFTTYIYMVLHYAPSIPCACGGVISHLSWNQHLWFNVAFTFIAGIGISFYPSIQNKKLTDKEFVARQTGKAENLKQSRHFTKNKQTEIL
jgi:uncharacterized membrane protein YphA (DoxX/SURF4 family)